MAFSCRSRMGSVLHRKFIHEDMPTEAHLTADHMMANFFQSLIPDSSTRTHF